MSEDKETPAAAAAASDPMLERPNASSSNADGSSTGSGTRLKRELGLIDGASIIIGIIVGSGIFVSPKGVLMEAGSVGMSLAVWAMSGLLCLVGGGLHCVFNVSLLGGFHRRQVGRAESKVGPARRTTAGRKKQTR